jgi:hypothetical protein
MRSLALIAALTSLLLGSSFRAVDAQDAVGQAYDWTVKIETEQLDQQFDYEGSPFKHPTKLNISTYPQDNEKAASPYEKMWYHDGMPLGQDRTGKFVQRGDVICIRVVGKKGSQQPAELKAAANAVMRLWLDAKANQNPLAVVRVPAASFGIMQSYIAMQHCVEVPMNTTDRAQKNYMRFTLESEPPGQKVKYAYQR